MTGKVQFADFAVDFRTGELRRRGILVPIQGKPLAVLAILVERPGELVSREDLYKALWQGQTFVDYDKNLGVAVAKLREVLEDSSQRPRFIETIPRHGYRFVGSIHPDPVVDPHPAISVQAPAQLSLPSDTQAVAARVAQDAPSVELALNAAAGLDGFNTRRRRLPRSLWAGAIAAAVVIFASLYFRSPAQSGTIVSPSTALLRVNPEAQQDYLKAKAFSERWIVDDVKAALIFDDRATLYYRECLRIPRRDG